MSGVFAADEAITGRKAHIPPLGGLASQSNKLLKESQEG